MDALGAPYIQAGHGAASGATSVSGATLLLAAIISAGTAALVSLGVEWLAKPRLEARKERILANYRRDAEIRRQLARILECGIRLSDYPRMTDLHVEQQSRLRESYDSFIDRATEAARILDDAISEMTVDIDLRMYGLFTAYLGFVIGTLGSNNTNKRKGQLLGAGTLPVRSAYLIPRWRHLHKKHKIELAEYILRNPPGEEDMDKP